MERGLEAIVQELESRGKQVILVSPISELENDIWNLIIRLSLFSDESALPPATTRARFEQRQARILDILDRVSRGNAVSTFDPSAILCGAEVCDAARNGVSLYFDDNHLSVAGAQLLARAIAQRLGLD